jgi:hypothetical protein
MNLGLHRMRAARRRPLFAPVGFALLALLGIFSSEGFTPDASAASLESSCGVAFHASQESQSIASPVLPEPFVSASVPALRPGLPVDLETTLECFSEAVVCPRTRTTVDLHADLIAVRVLEKYLHFRQSLSTP